MTGNWLESLHKIISWLICLLLLPSLVQAQDNLSQAIPLDPNIKQGMLPNGLTYFIQKNSEPKNYAQLRLAVRVGSNVEEDDQQGAAHFVKHAVFRGTKNFSKQDIQDFRKRTGFPLDPDSNADTEFNETYYVLQIPLDSAGVLESGLDLLKEWGHNAILDSAEIETERDILVEETKRDISAEQRMRIAYFKLLLKNSRYGERLPILDKEHIEKLKVERLRQFYTDWYRPDLMAIAAVGDFDPELVEQLIRKKFGSIPKSENPKKRVDYTIPLTGGTQIFILTDSSATECTVSVKHYWPDFEVKTQDSILNDVVNRFFKVMVMERISGFDHISYALGNFLGGCNEFSPNVPAKNADEVEGILKTISNKVAYIRQFGFTQMELEAARRGSRETLIGAPYEDGKHSGHYAQDYIFYFVNGYPIFDRAFYADFVSSKIDDVTLEEVNQWTKKILDSERRSIVITGPESQKDKLPTEARIRELLDSAGRGAVSPVEVQIKKLTENLEGKKSISKKQYDRVGVTEIVLSNGVRVLLKPFDPAENFTQFTGKAKGGTSLFTNELENARYAKRFLYKHAISPFDADKLEEYNNKKFTSVSASIDKTSRNISGYASQDGLEAALQVVYAYFTASDIDPSAARSLLADYQALLEKKLPDNKAMLDDVFDLALDGINQPLRLTTAENIDKISIDHAFEIYKSLFANASDFTFVFVGSFEIQEIQPLLEKYLGTLPTNKKGSSQNISNTVLHKGRIEKTVFNTQNSVNGVRLIFGGGYDFEPDAPMQFEVIQAALSKRLYEAAQDLGGTLYRVWDTREKLNLPANYYSYTMDIACSPGVVDQIVEIALKVIEKIKAKGVEAELIEEHLAFWVPAKQKQMEVGSYRLDNILASILEGRDLDDFPNQEKYLKAVSPASTKAAAQKFFTDDFFIKVVLVPEKK